jgi:threonine synthase
MAQVFTGLAVDESATAAMMRSAYQLTGELIDPHTAVALAGAGEAKGPLITLSTAHAAKFPEAVAAATGVSPPTPPAVVALAGRAEHSDPLPADAEAVKAYVRGWR